MGGWADWAEDETRRIRAAGLWRTVRDVDGPGPATAVSPIAGAGDGAGGEGERAVVSFASNDYLGLSRHPAVLAAATEAVVRGGAGAGSARLVAGARPMHRRLESALAAWKGAEAAVLFATGYMANVGVLQALGGTGATIVSDRLNHASIVDGCRLSKVDVVVTPHADVAAVEAAVAAAVGRVLVVTESVFSMDGDVAPLGLLARLCARHGALLVVDDAHAVLGPEIPDGSGQVLRIGTLSKALGSLGGFVTGPAGLCDLVVQRARSFVFTTASTPADTAAALAALSIVRSPEGDALRARLRANVDRLQPGHPSPVVAVVVGDEEAAMRASADLLAQGLLVPAIRPPTVPPGTARLRISLTAAHTPEQVDRLAGALAAMNLGRRTATAQPAPAAHGAAIAPGAEPVGAPAPDGRLVTTAFPTPPSSGSEVTGRPLRMVLVLGTGTTVGKTWLTARLAEALRRAGSTPAARKLVQSFEPGSGPTDADLLAAATGESPAAVCPPHRSYAIAMAPPLAAEALGLAPFTLSDVLAELRWPPDTDIGLVEGVGGPRSPLAADADNVALAADLDPDTVVLVADAGLGAINAVLLAVDALPLPPVVFLNRFDPADPVHAGNADWLTKRSGLRLTTKVDDLVRLLSRK